VAFRSGAAMSRTILTTTSTEWLAYRPGVYEQNFLMP
jgi:membrane carboxypeptidase/penicillin-binding protein PbpC